jgi:hypothetical protein
VVIFASFWENDKADLDPAEQEMAAYYKTKLL